MSRKGHATNVHNRPIGNTTPVQQATSVCASGECMIPRLCQQAWPETPIQPWLKKTGCGVHLLEGGGMARRAPSNRVPAVSDAALAAFGTACQNAHRSGVLCSLRSACEQASFRLVLDQNSLSNSSLSAATFQGDN
jgi:hypothetical protein